MEKFKKHTKFIGLWRVDDTQYFRTPAINISELKKYKGTIRIVFTQNKSMVEYNIGCPYFAWDERDHCYGSEELPTRKMCGQCKLEWLEAEVDE